MSAQIFSPERLMQVILAPQVSEKATYIAEKHNHVIFRVAQDATKAEIKAAVELMWKSPEYRGGKCAGNQRQRKEKALWSFHGTSQQLEEGLCQH